MHASIIACSCASLHAVLGVAIFFGGWQSKVGDTFLSQSIGALSVEASIAVSATLLSTTSEVVASGEPVAGEGALSVEEQAAMISTKGRRRTTPPRYHSVMQGA
jgi:hypothetical protein